MEAKNRNKIFVKNIVLPLVKGDLTAYFSTFGQVIKVEIILDIKGRYRGFGFVTFQDAASACKACLQTIHTVNFTTIRVEKAKSDEKHSPELAGKFATNCDYLTRHSYKSRYPVQQTFDRAVEP